MLIPVFYLSEPILTNAMRQACAVARGYLGATTPNPPVGAVALNAAGEVLATAAHQKAGSAHAEAALLRDCRERGLLAEIHTLVVTLEPCNHHGRTPPCTAAILEADIKHVVIGATDPNPEVAGGGAEFLRQHGVHVTTGIAEAECQQLIASFATAKRARQPWITVKRAFDARGSMIPPQGRKTFTSPDMLVLAHRLRKKADAIITGNGTIRADAPHFTVRHVRDYPGKSRFLAIADRRRIVPPEYLAEAAKRGFYTLIFDRPEQVIADLFARGVQDILVEAGPALSHYFLNHNLWQLRVDIHAGNPDRVEAPLNPERAIPFDRAHFDLNNILPI
jgi:diaminohydroxyphosphoribosylaminopyrimidine deaminase/5-amino-6-(5-phosphoribosylamino)uracil reductase